MALWRRTYESISWLGGGSKRDGYDGFDGYDGYLVDEISEDSFKYYEPRVFLRILLPQIVNANDLYQLKNQLL